MEALSRLILRALVLVVVCSSSLGDAPRKGTPCAAAGRPFFSFEHKHEQQCARDQRASS